MAKSVGRTFALVIAVVVAVVAGYILGAFQGYRLGRNEILDLALLNDAGAIDRYVTTLEHMRAGEGEEATEVLEAWLDDVLVFVMGVEEYRTSENTGNELAAAFERARAYRSEFPRTSDRAFVDQMVAALFEKGPPRIR